MNLSDLAHLERERDYWRDETRAARAESCYWLTTADSERERADKAEREVRYYSSVVDRVVDERDTAERQRDVAVSHVETQVRLAEDLAEDLADLTDRWETCYAYARTLEQRCDRLSEAADDLAEQVERDHLSHVDHYATFDKVRQLASLADGYLRRYRERVGAAGTPGAVLGALARLADLAEELDQYR